MKLINPAIVERDGSIVWEEGCLSVPDFTAPVTRAKRIVVRAWTPEQKEIEIEAEELLAVALQHEIDHLDGKLFLDRISRLKRDRGRGARGGRGGGPYGGLLWGAAPRAGASFSGGRGRAPAASWRPCSHAPIRWSASSASPTARAVAVSPSSRRR